MLSNTTVSNIAISIPVSGPTYPRFWRIPQPSPIFKRTKNPLKQIFVHEKVWGSQSYVTSQEHQRLNSAVVFLEMVPLFKYKVSFGVPMIDFHLVSQHSLPIGSMHGMVYFIYLLAFPIKINLQDPCLDMGE